MKDLRDHEATCRATLRMGIDAFDIFCQKLRLTGVLKDYNRATFTYVLAGWEGTASDSRIIKNAFARPHGLVIPEGKMMPKKGKEVADGPTRENVVWTEEMDNELLDCVLTEQRKGNRQEGQFTTHALTNVVYALRTKFPSIRLDKDKVKNRQRTLKKHFADVKDLFHNMSGFAWNPETKLFEAEREVWERLCEEKPNAKQWIRKPINNYDKLFELYGEHRAMGNGASSAFERLDTWNMQNPTSDINLVDLSENPEDADDEGANVFTPTSMHTFSSEGKKMPKKGKEVADGPTRENVHWTEEMDNELLDCLLTEQRKGNRQEGQLTAHALTNVVYALLTKFPNIRLDKDKVKNRQKTFKKHFADVKDLFHNMSGFAWNPETKLFEAEREVWERLCEEKPNAKQWIRKPINNYDKLFELYGEHKAMGNGGASAFEKLDRWNMRAPTSDINLADLPENLEDVDDEVTTTFTPTGTHAFSPEGMPTISSERSPSINSQGTSSRGIKRKAPMGNLMLDKIDEMRTNIASMVQAIEQGNLIAERSARALEKGNEIKENSLMILEHQKAHVYKEAEIYAELIRLNVPQHKVMLAYRNFARSPENTRLLFGLPEDRRLQFVEMALLWSTNM
ncbi:unnamed protein product [Linum tenue]|uniref:Myb/SANT-like domain-containing protein n=1 Tax=Linum tenue TaxID=586396 RepID=A0AAV0NVB8_9ROSI|nr:unnamed protein product [Linum tenue]